MSAPNRSRVVGIRIEQFLDQFMKADADRVLARLELVQLAELAQQQALDHMAALREQTIAPQSDHAGR